MTTRRLAAVLAADVVGYSAMMERDEEGTAARIRALRRDVIEPLLSKHGGRLVKTTGDGFLAEFASPVEAVRSALAVQDQLSGAEQNDSPIQLRIGINLGDIIVEDDGDVFGDGVNVAARLEQTADPGGICISDEVHRHIVSKIDRFFEDRGEQQVKNIARPVRIYALAGVTSAAMREGAKSLPLPDKPSIAVLPFTNMSGDPEQEYFADGVVEDIITALSRVKWLFVIARNSSYTYKGRAVDIRQIGRDLGVHYVLEGSIRKAGNRVRVSGQLIEAGTRTHVWADRFEGALDDIFALQDEITQSVVAAVEPTVRSVEIARAQAKRTDNLGAYDLYLRALPEFHKSTEMGFRRAESLLREALNIDPSYGEAWAALADCITRLALSCWIPDWADACREGCDAAMQAITCDPENGTVLATAAFSLCALGAELDLPVELAYRALNLQPSSSMVRISCGWVFIFDGQYQLALEQFHLARRLSPLDPRAYLINNGIAAVSLYKGCFDDAEVWTRRSLEKWPFNAVTLRIRTAALVRLGRTDEAKDVLARLLKVQPNVTAGRTRSIKYRHKDLQQEFIDALKLAGLPE